MLPDSLRESASPMTESRKIRHMFDPPGETGPT